MRNIITIVFALLLFAIPAIRPLIPSELEPTHNIAIVASIVLFLAHQIMLVWNPSIPKEDINSKFPFFQRVLAEVKKNMADEIERCNPQKAITADNFRLNVMLPVKRRFLFGRARIKIFFYTDQYTEQERNIYWYKGKKGSGTCGEAWNLAQPVIFDNNNPDYRQPKNRLDDKQMAIARIVQIRSVLSFPIWGLRKNRIIGVLNLDSDHNVDRAFFDQKNVIDRGLQEAHFIAYILPGRVVAV
ncbi:MAG: GAF domain-containing protein [candidate division Zixibacteria bacterium]|nr:GAF domain-containing protein [candidate division Zixibacteria bacterium]